jgi:hypothetical protein
LLFTLSTKGTIHVKNVRGGNKCGFYSGTMSDETIQWLVKDYCAFQPRCLEIKKYELVLQDTSTFDISLEDDGLMLILSSGQPMKVQRIWAGKRCVIIIGQMSTESIKMIVERFGVKFKDEGEGIYKVVSRR